MPVRLEMSRQDRWRALGLLIGVLAVLYLILLHPWWTLPMLRLGQDIDALRERAARIEAQIAQAPDIEAALARLESGDAGTPGFMPEASVQLATAALVQQLEATVRTASPGNRSCAILNRTPLTDPRSGRFPRAAVQVRLSCGNAELGAVLHALESNRPRLFVDKLSIIAQRERRLGAADSNGGGVDVSFELSGYLLPPTHPGGSSDAR